MATNGQKKLFIDIETVWCYDYTSEKETESFAKTATSKIWLNRYWEKNEPKDMAFYAEFGKVICFAVGAYDADGNFKTNAVCNDNEKELLQQLAMIMEKFDVFVWHNINHFDIPFIIKRMIINDIPVPKSLDFRNKKWYEMPNIIHDTMQMRKFTRSGAATWLETIANVLGVANPKNIMDGSEVAPLYWASRGNMWQDDNWLWQLFCDQVKTYCIADVQATKEIYEKINNAFIQ